MIDDRVEEVVKYHTWLPCNLYLMRGIETRVLGRTAAAAQEHLDQIL